MTVIGSMLEKILDIGEHIILKPIVLLLFMFACFNLLVPTEIIADETDYTGFGLYKDGEKIVDLESNIEPSIFGDFNNINDDLTPLAKRYLEFVKKSDDYYQHESVIFSNLLKGCKDLINKVHSDNLSFDSPEAEMLNMYIPKIMDSHDSLLEEILQMEVELKESDLPTDVIQNHNIEMEKFKARTAELIELLESCQFSVEQKDNTLFNNTITALITHFNEMESERKKYQEAIPLTLPKPSINEFKEAPRMKGDRPLPVHTASDYYGNESLRDDPVQIYLDETIDVQFTPEIEALAAELNHSPVEIYQYVRNNFDFEIYIGSRKGSQQTLDHRRGNDYDLASLLIALLRVSEIHSRYNTATAIIPYDRFCNWLGVDDPVNAANLLSEVGFNVVLDEENDVVYLDLVFVEAYLPTINYRGAINDAHSKRWIPLDPTFKQYQYSSSINLLDELTNDFEEEVFIEEYYSTLREETPLEWFQQAMADSLALYFPDADFEDIIRTRTVIKETDEILPGTLPYTVDAYGSSFANISDNMRYKINFMVKYLSGYNILTHTISVPEIVGKQITVSYVGYSYWGQNLIEQYGGIFSIHYYYFSDLYLRPVLNIDGCVIASGSHGIYTTVFNTVCVEFIPPTGAPLQDECSITTRSGDYVGIGINTGSTFPVQFDNPQNSCDEPYAGQVLHQTAMSYLNTTNDNENALRNLLHIKSWNDISVAFLFNDIHLDIQYNHLYGYDWGGLIISCQGGLEHHVSTDLECSDYIREYNSIAGADGSIRENRVFEDNFNAEAVSAIKILQLANDRGMPICEIENSISGDCPGFDHPYEVRNLIQYYVDNPYIDYKVIIPQQTDLYDQWLGTGIIIMNMETCAARYVCAGRIYYPGVAAANYYTDGGATINTWPLDDYPDLYCIWLDEPITVDPPAPNDFYWAGSNDILTFTVPGIDYYSSPPVCGHLGHEDNVQCRLPYSIQYMADTWGPGEYTFVAGRDGVTECDCNQRSKTVTIVDVEVVLANDVVCDGEAVPISLNVQPSGVPTPQNVEFSSATHSMSYGNPIGHTTLSFDPYDPAQNSSRIQNAIWYSNQPDYCNVLSSYTISATADIGGINMSSTHDPALTVSTSFESPICTNGNSGVGHNFLGDPDYHFFFNSLTQQWEVTVTIGNFDWEVIGYYENYCSQSSQYWQQVEDEEQFHIGQYEGTNSDIFIDLWDPELVIDEVQANQPYTHANRDVAEQLAIASFEIAKFNERTRSFYIITTPEPDGRQCQMESEAKTAIGASYRGTMPCAYPDCP